MPATVDRHLTNYRMLVARVDALCRQIETDFCSQIVCRRGCDACCRHLSLFRVEGVALAQALRKTPEPTAARIRDRARLSSVDGPCPLLENGVCQLYPARPIICRTHGLPLLFGEAETRRVDYCPENFRGLDALPASAVIDLERLNTTLAAVDTLFVSAFCPDRLPGGERLTIAESLLLEF